MIHCTMLASKKGMILTMNRTVKQMCEAINVSKTRLYRFIEKENIQPINANVKTKLYDENAQSVIFQHFTGSSDIHISNANAQSSSDNNATTDTTTANKDTNEMIELLKSELNNKNKEIATLHRLLDQQQQLDLANAKLISSYRDTDNANNDTEQPQDSSSSNNATDDKDKDKRKKRWFFW